MLEQRTIRKDVPIPLYYQLKNLILEEIDSGNYPLDSLIPTEKDFAEMFSISRTTIRQAISELVQEGRLYRIKSKGTFVAHPKIRQDFMYCLRSFNNEITDSGRKPSTQVLALGKVLMPEPLAEKCRELRGAEAVFLYRKRCADGDPIVRVKTYLPYDRCKNLLAHDFSRESLYGVLSSSPDTQICRVSRTCEAIAASEDDVEILGLKRGSPVHFFTTFGYNKSDEVIEYSLAYYRGDQNQFRVEINLDTYKR